jgi:hypothetical protein
MILEGRLYQENRMIRETAVERADTQERWVWQLEQCLIELCRQLEAPLPLWLEKNTHEFACFRQTLFFAEQFVEPTRFDRMQIRLVG